ncbi:MAG: SDR family oxidoreductase [Chromatiales bacterium]|jgi:NAD(P)-dependent dehydrogenase (short-subunit alcohol dehydrogenase family)
MKERFYAVVGGTSGIGQELVRRLAAAGAGAVVLSRRPPDRPAAGGVAHLVWDATGSEPPTDLPDRLDGLAYCPGSIRLKPFQRTTDDDFREDLEVNLMGAVRAIRGCLPALRKGTDPSIVLLSTVAARTGMAFHASIASAKGAVEGLTRALAAELAPRIRVNAVAPSLTDTPLASGLLGTEDKRKASAERHPLGRVGEPDDVAEAMLYLLSPASRWVTGQVLAVDGGLSSVRLFR